MRKRSVTIDGHRTSVSLEDAFWAELSAIADQRGLSLNALVAEIDHGRSPGNLSSARLFVLDSSGNERSVEFEAFRAHECAEIGAVGHQILPDLVFRPAIFRILAEFIDMALLGVGLHGAAALVVGRDLLVQSFSS